MALLIRIAVAIIVGILVDAILNYFNLLTPSINALIGLLLALLVFWQYDGTFGHRV